MPRYPDELIERIKSDVSLERLLAAQGHNLKNHGQDLITTCPFHEDKTPSLVISPDTNLWHCLGACQTGGSVIDWVMKREAVSFRHAIELLKHDLPHLDADNPTNSKPIKRSSTPKLPPLAANPDNQRLLRQVIDHYHRTLTESPDALAYLQSRGLHSSELLQQFKLGYANRTLSYRLPQKNRQSGAAIRTQLQEIGLLRSSGHEHFNGCLVVPVISATGVIEEVYGRKIGKALRKGTAQHLYLPGPHRGVWNVPALAASSQAILCESLMDAMTFWVHGYRNVTSSYGTSGFTFDHLTAFEQHSIQRVYIAYDRDRAGNTAAEKLAETLMDKGIECFRLLFPQGMDANAYAQAVSDPAERLGAAIRKAEWLGKAPTPSPTPPQPPPLAAPSSPPPPAEEDEVTAASTELPQTEIQEHEIKLSFGTRHYRIRGLDKNLSYDQLKLNLLIRRDKTFHVDTLDLYNARHRSAFLKQASHELCLSTDTLKADLAQVLLQLEELQDQQIQQALKPKTQVPHMSQTELKAALELLKQPNLLERILQDFDRCGVVGEQTNKLVGYLAATSRKLDAPLAVLIQSSSAAGKSSLMDAILALIPAEAQIKYSAMTGQSLFYMGETDLKHKILAIAEQEGADQASYALKLLQSEGEITIASTGKDVTTGKLQTVQYRVEGPMMLMMTTTAIDIDEELLNRCLVLTVNESRAQTEAIHARQRQHKTLAGLLAQQQRQDILKLHQNAQRLLRPLLVANPYAEQLTFVSTRTRTRRDHLKYLGLIQTIALLHQHQRPIERVEHNGRWVEYIEVTLDDIEIANRLAHQVLGRSLDELPPQTRRLLVLIQQMVIDVCTRQNIAQPDYRFSRKDIRSCTGWSDQQLKVHCRRLTELEYLLIHSGSRGQSFQYELLYDGNPAAPGAHQMGLIDLDHLRQEYDTQKNGPILHKKGPSLPQVAPKFGPSTGASNPVLNGHRA
ncbi:CHC2 zinc finger domain-containing protein [Synechococcus sp. PCC 7336]|uniref:CHC2 zinc finger domain-containing protein n=1 Tax=Synechococcus sp. PCC 7336 TaxID=195250 RepID=UPI00034CC767|nr:CHC2 zinc finger domain-containing protein [Synechococcus sp. PCC 7336]